MESKFCNECGNKLIYKNIVHEGDIPYCTKCNKPHFPFSFPCVICLVKYKEKYVLIKQSYVSENYIIIAGHIKFNSTAEQTVLDEVKEELGLDVVKYKYINSYYHERRGNIMFGFLVEAEGNINICEDEVDSYILVGEKEAIELLSSASIAKQLLLDSIK